jgi:hypothetical protein
MGARNLQPKNLQEAAGRLMDRHSAEACFGCHTTSASSNDVRRTASLMPGVTCERCHGSGLPHVEGFREVKPVQMKQLSGLSTEELSDFCGQCHRTWAQIAAEGPHDINNVRFQPYRLTNSKCYDPSDRRISLCLNWNFPGHTTSLRIIVYERSTLMEHTLHRHTHRYAITNS